ncbi:MAG: thiamine pyrophosphate-dependent enzyme [Litorilinea sp.]
MPTLNGGEALIQTLYRVGIRTVFGIPGLGQYEAVDALYSTPEIRYISVRNEQAASYMADGYARATGKIAAVLVVPGPGLMNAGAGMATAYAASTPMLVITGTDHQREGLDELREAPLLASVTKWTRRARHVAEIPDLVYTAMQQLRQGRPRPVAIEIPQEVLADRQFVDLDASAQPSVPRVQTTAPTADPVARATLAQAVAWMRAAQRPLIWAGGGVHTADAHAPLRAVAERWHAPVMTGRSGKGALSDRHPLALGFGELRFGPLRRRFDESDVILAVGTSMDFSRHPGKVIHINIDPRHAGPHEAAPDAGAPDTDVSDADASRLGLRGDARAILAALLAQAVEAGQDFAPDSAVGDSAVGDSVVRSVDAQQAEVAAINGARVAPDQQLQPQAAIMAAIRRALPDEAILATDMTQLGYYSRNFYAVCAPRSYFTCTRLWTLGAAFPMALGAAVGEQAASLDATTGRAANGAPVDPRPVVALMGDGGFLYNAQELATAVQYEIPVVVVLFNDHAYGNVLRAQQEEFDGHEIGTRLHNPDFMQLAQSYGVWSRRVHDAGELEAALVQALAETQATHKPALIEMPVGPMQRSY